MPFSGGEDIATNKMHETLKLLHETIQKQIKATEEQSKIMIRLTRFLLGFTIVLCFLGCIQIAAMFTQNLNTTTRNINTPSYNQQIGADSPLIQSRQNLPQTVKGVNERKHK